MTPSFEYCPSCAAENPPRAERCQACGTRMDAPIGGGASRTRPMQWKWVGLFAGPALALLILLEMTPFINLFFFPVRATESAVIVSGSLITVLEFLFVFALCGGIVATVSHRRVTRE